MAKPRKRKVLPPANLWEMPIEVVQARYDRLANFKGSKLAAIYKAELERKDRSKPMDLDKLFNHEDHE